jgi:hypothetical protein
LGFPERFANEYNWEGGANLFMFFEPLMGIYLVTVTDIELAKIRQR